MCCRHSGKWTFSSTHSERWPSGNFNPVIGGVRTLSERIAGTDSFTGMRVTVGNSYHSVRFNTLEIKGKPTARRSLGIDRVASAIVMPVERPTCQRLRMTIHCKKYDIDLQVTPHCEKHRLGFKWAVFCRLFGRTVRSRNCLDATACIQSRSTRGRRRCPAGLSSCPSIVLSLIHI